MTYMLKCRLMCWCKFRLNCGRQAWQTLFHLPSFTHLVHAKIPAKQSIYTSYLKTHTLMFAVLAPLFLLLSFHTYSQSAVVNVQLAQVYKLENDELNIGDYLVSKKYDGFRAIWKNNKLTTRNGHEINAPAWFTQDLPSEWLDGELWYALGEFEFVASTVTKTVPNNAQWRKISYRVFDAPNNKDPFHIRAQHYTTLLTQANIAHVKPVIQQRIKTHKALMALLNSYTQHGGEGLMLQKSNALFANGRSGNLLKLKKYMDAEGTVLKHLPGKGKYKHSMGSLLVRHKNADGINIEFKVGSGFSDAQRQHPPAIGSTITFSYHGYTKRGIPRFASFMRVRHPLASK